MTNNDFFAPVDSISMADRQQAEQRLREAHSLGRIDAAELDARMARVITAERLDELAAAVDGPLPPTQSAPYASYQDNSGPSYGQPYSQAPGASYGQFYGEPYAEPSNNGSQHGRPTFSGAVQQTRQGISERGTGMAVLAHLSPFLTWLIGPAVIWALSAKGSYTRREAAKAFNWQLLAFIVGILVSAIGWIIPGEGNPIAGIWTAIWVVVTVIGAVMASRGADWRNPIRRLVPVEVLSEGGR